MFDGIYASGINVPNNSYDFADLSLTDPQNEQRSLNSGFNDLRLISYFSRLQYNYKGKYLFSGLVRRDAASVFDKDLRVDYFWSATTGWKVSDEGFRRGRGAQGCRVTVTGDFRLNGWIGLMGYAEISHSGHFFRFDCKISVRKPSVIVTLHIRRTWAGRSWESIF